MTATIIAEALAAAEAETPLVLHHHRVVVLNQHGRVSGDSSSLDLAEPQDWRTQFVRADVVEFALKHLAERAARAEAEVRSLRAVVRQAHLDLETGSEASCTVSLHLYRALDDAAREAKP